MQPPPLVRRRWPRIHQGRELEHQRAILGAPSRTMESVGSMVRSNKMPRSSSRRTQTGASSARSEEATCAPRNSLGPIFHTKVPKCIKFLDLPFLLFAPFVGLLFDILGTPCSNATCRVLGFTKSAGHNRR